LNVNADNLIQRAINSSISPSQNKKDDKEFRKLQENMRTSSMPSSTPCIAQNANNRDESDVDDYRIDTELSKY
jgi:succinate dehydrogenase/fumarate reductase flavoprotein subunit